MPFLQSSEKQTGVLSKQIPTYASGRLVFKRSDGMIKTIFTAVHASGKHARGWSSVGAYAQMQSSLRKL